MNIQDYFKGINYLTEMELLDPKDSYGNTNIDIPHSLA